jgi:hypothetical protein
MLGSILKFGLSLTYSIVHQMSRTAGIKWGMVWSSMCLSTSVTYSDQAGSMSFRVKQCFRMMFYAVQTIASKTLCTSSFFSSESCSPVKNKHTEDDDEVNISSRTWSTYKRQTGLVGAMPAIDSPFTSRARCSAWELMVKILTSNTNDLRQLHMILTLCCSQEELLT